VRDETEAMVEETVALGLRNQRIVELATAHCLNFEWRSMGGVGMVEAETGLPIGMRLPHCAYASSPGGMAGADLEPVALAFYGEHCVGCEHRRPTGRVPNLATRAAEQRAAAERAEEADRIRLEKERTAWQQRADRRAALIAAATDATTAPVLHDVDLLDADPAERDRPDPGGPLGRLRAVGERAAEHVSDDVARHLLQLVVERRGVELLAVLRPLALARPAYTRPVLQAALDVLRTSAHVDAGRCLVDLSASAAAGDVTHDVVRSLARLSAPAAESVMDTMREVPGGAADPTALRTAATLAPDTVRATLQDALRASGTTSPLLLPTGTRPTEDSPSDAERAAAAAAVAALSASHPDLAAELAEPLLTNLRMPDNDRYGMHPRSRVARAAACLLVRGLGDVPRRLLEIGRHAGSDHRSALVNVLQHAAWLLDPEPRWPQRDDPTPTGAQHAELVRSLAELCLHLTDGCWGEDVTHTASTLLEALTGDHPDVLLALLPALMGAALEIDRRAAQPLGPSPLLAAGPPPDPTLSMFDRFNRSTAMSGAAHRLLLAVEELASRDVHGVVAAARDLLADQRDREDPSSADQRLLDLLGRVGARHGSDPAVLNAVLPVLHTHLVSADVALRATAIDAWTDIAQRHPNVPDSLSALLPALTADRYVAVMRAVLRAARHLSWEGEDHARLLVFALEAGDERVATDHPDLFKDALPTVLALVRSADPEIRVRVQRLVLTRADRLDGYALQELLRRRSWEDAVATSPELARLWLRQARDPTINDRVNEGDDDELVALLGCGPGLAALPVEELTAAAVELLPGSPYAAAEFAEVAWRAGRPDDAQTILHAAREAVPDQPVYRRHRNLLALWAQAAALDAAAAAGTAADVAAARDAARQVGDDWGAEPTHSRPAGAAPEQLAARVVLRTVLSGHVADPPLLDLAGLAADLAPVTGEDPVARQRRRADQLSAASDRIRGGALARTPTGAYLRSLLDACDVAVRLLRLHAAILDADIPNTDAQRTAAHGRAAAHYDTAHEALRANDPLAEPLLQLLERAIILDDSKVANWITELARLPIPLMFVRGPRRWSAGTGAPAAIGEGDQRAAPVVVALASLDGRLITDTQVMTPGRVHTLELEVRLGGVWPDWADRLEGSFVSHIRTPDDAEIPNFSWTRPADSEQPLTGDGTLIIRFTITAGGRAPQLVLALRFVGTVDGAPAVQQCDVAGHRQLRIRPFDASVDVLTGWSSVDERLLSRYERLHTANYGEDEIQAYCRLLTAVCRAGFRMSYEQAYRAGARVSERQFHNDLEARLLADPELGGRVERGTRAALGFLDLRHDRVTAELKVELRTAVTEERSPKYLGQPTQYAAADGARLSLLVVLDMSCKTSPIGTPENYIWDLQPRLHGLTNPEAPSLTTVVVVNGGLPTPSTWSRRKIEIETAEDQPATEAGPPVLGSDDPPPTGD